MYLGDTIVIGKFFDHTEIEQSIRKADWSLIEDRSHQMLFLQERSLENSLDKGIAVDEPR